MLRRMKAYLALAALLPVLAGCAAAGLIGELPLYEEGINLSAENYAATDVIVEQLRKRVHSGRPIIVQDFWNNHSPQVIAPFGRVIPEQVATRLIQLGYRVIQPRYATQTQDVSPELLLAGQNLSAESLQKFIGSPHIILSGSYTKGVGQVKIHIRLTDSTSGVFVAAYDYDLPLTREIEELMGLR